MQSSRTAMRYDVNENGKRGIFWQNGGTHKQKQKKFGYESKNRNQQSDGIKMEESVKKATLSKPFLQNNRTQISKQRGGPNRRHFHAKGLSPGETSSRIAPGTVTLTEDQLNALLRSVGRLSTEDDQDLGTGSDAEKGFVNVGSARAGLNTVDSKCCGDRASGASHPEKMDGHRSHGDSSLGYGSEDKYGDAKDADFRSVSTQGNERQAVTGERKADAAPHNIPWRHMTVAERKRLEWARERAAEEELQRQVRTDLMDRPWAQSMSHRAPPSIQQSGGVSLKPTGSDCLASGQKSKQEQEQKLRQAIDDIETKYRRILQLAGEDMPCESQPRADGLDLVCNKNAAVDVQASLSSDHKSVRIRQTHQPIEGKMGNTMMTGVQGKHGADEKKGVERFEQVGGSDRSDLLGDKERRRKHWLAELDVQREEKRIERQREKETARTGIDDTWADRFLPDTAARTRNAICDDSCNRRSDEIDQNNRTIKSKDRTFNSTDVPLGCTYNGGDVKPALGTASIGNRNELKQAEDELGKVQEVFRDIHQPKGTLRQATSDAQVDVGNKGPFISCGLNAPSLTSPSDCHHSHEFYSSYQPLVKESTSEQNVFLRGQNVHIDPITMHQLEEKRNKDLLHQAAIKAQIEEKTRLIREEKEKKWNDDLEEERRLIAQRDAVRERMEAEDTRHQQKEVARQRKLDQLKSMMDVEQERAQEERMMKRLTSLRHGGHDISSLKATYEASRSPRNNPASSGCTAHTMNSQSRPHDDMDSFLQHSLTNGSAENSLCHQDGVALKAMASNSGGRHTAQGKGCLEYQAMTNGQLRHTSNHSDGAVIFKHDSATQTGDLIRHIDALEKEISAVEIEVNGQPERHLASHHHDNKKYTSRKKEGDTDRDGRCGIKSHEMIGSEKSKLVRGKPTIWNYQNREHKVARKQSEKDPFYKQKCPDAGSRHMLQERQLNYLTQLNSPPSPKRRPARRGHHCEGPVHSVSIGQVVGRRAVKDASAVDRSASRDHRLQVDHTDRHCPVRLTTLPVSSTGSRNHDGNAVLYSKATGSTGPDRCIRSTDRRSQEELKNTEFVPFMRTSDVLDPARSGEEVPLSREGTRIKLARQCYRDGMRPADFGRRMDVCGDGGQHAPPATSKNPILNPSCIVDVPTARQDQILQQLSSLKESLIQRRRELETVMSSNELENGA